jgi:hypothetical protein
MGLDTDGNERGKQDGKEEEEQREVDTLARGHVCA